MADIAGNVAPGFERVEEAFRANFADQEEIGAACCLYVGGEPVVDLWGGLADRQSQAPWRRDTLALIFSATKGVTAVCVHLLAERGLLDLDAPIVRYWPEFAAAGKESVPVRWALSHRVGLPVVEAKLSRAEVFAWDPVVRALAAQAPAWPPGSAHGYHARTFGWILGEVVRRVTGATLGELLAREVARPLGLDLFVGLPAEMERRVATIYPPPAPTDPAEIEIRNQFMGPGTLLYEVLNGPADLSYGDIWNTRELHAAELPSSNGIASARSLARFYAALLGPVDGVRLLRAETVEQASRPQSEGPDGVIMLPTRFSSGFMLPPVLGLECPPSCFGHPGAGGALGFADPERGVAFAYVMNRMKLGLTGDERTGRLIRAVYASL